MENKNIILETDLNLSNEKRDDGTFGRFMPFLHQSAIITQHFKMSLILSNCIMCPFIVIFNLMLKWVLELGIKLW